MAKKKSKSQKQRKSIKRKINKVQNDSLKSVKVEKTLVKEVKKKETQNKISEEKKAKNSAKKTKQLVSKDEIIYNVPITKQKSTKKKENVTSNRKLADNSGVISKLPDLFLKKDAPKRNSKTNKMKQNENKFNLFIKNIKEKINNISKKTQKKTKTKATQKKTNSSKLQIKKQATYNKKNVFVRFLYYLKNNVHVLFNSLLIVVFIVLLVGGVRAAAFTKGFIIYVSLILLFLMLVAMSHNKYLSGKIFTIVLTVIMSYGIYYLQYTYDFIRNLNSSMYEYKTYYVVSLDINNNKSIYNINKKKVGLLTENSLNVERVLNVKLDSVNYNTFDTIDELINSFYKQELRAVIVNENQYKFMKNDNLNKQKDVKILYSFKANARK